MLLFYSGKGKEPVKWLALSYLSLCLVFFVLFLLRTRLILQVPHLYRTGNVFWLLYMPLSYLYICSIIRKQRPCRSDWVHAIPVILYVIDFAPFFLSSASGKKESLENGFINMDAIVAFSEGWLLPEGFYRWMLLVLPLFYWGKQVFIFYDMLRKKGAGFRRENHYWIIWIRYYLGFQALIFIAVLALFISSHAGYLLQISHVFAIITGLFIALSLFTNPAILFSRSIVDPFLRQAHGTAGRKRKEELIYVPGMETGKKEMAPGESAAVASRLRPLKNLAPDQISQMKAQVDLFLQKSQAFLQHGYSLQEMAKSLSYPLYQLSALINQEYGMNFNDLINKHRIDYAIDLIKNGKTAHLNINGLANQCGFNNRNSFTSAFKKFAGLTPSEYFKAHK